MHGVSDFVLENQLWVQEKLNSGPAFVRHLAMSLIVCKFNCKILSLLARANFRVLSVIKLYFLGPN